MRGRAQLLAGALLSTLWLVLLSGAAAAHPLGNFTTNTSTGLVVAPDGVDIDYVLDLAEVPAFQVLERLGRGASGRPDAGALTRYEETQCAELADGLRLEVGGRPTDLVVRGGDLSLPPGQAGLDTLRLECRLRAEVATQGPVSYTDGNFPERLGWREIVVRGAGTTVTGEGLRATSPSGRLTDYPQERLQSPLDERAVTFTARPGGGDDPAVPGASDPGASLLGPLERLSSSFTALVAAQDLTLGFGAAAFGAALVLGALHALAPGHGKTVMAAYLVGSRGTRRHAIGLGATVAVTHTAGVFLLGVVLSVSQTLAPARLYPALGTASGVLFAGVGLLLLRQALRNRHGHTHAHDHGHDHGHDHDHDHGHHHGQGGRAGGPRSPGWRSLLAPGLAGGLVPSPSALVVLLGGIALGRAWFGASLVVAYGIGMAATLVGAGYLLLRARDRIAELPTGSRLARLTRRLPVGTAALIVVGGVVIAARSAIAL